MGPEAAAGARAARGRLCHCPGNDPRGPPPQRGPERSSQTPWRPWMLTPGDAGLTGTRSLCEPGGAQQTLGSKGAFGFQHPVRLYLPSSKRQEYLRSSGEKVLASFPVQATIHFYNDQSESESDEEELGEETQPFQRQGQEAEGPETGPGGKGRAPLPSPWGGRGGLCSKGQPPHGDPPGGSDCSLSK